MQNKFYIFFFFIFTNLVYGKCDLGSENLNKFYDSNFSLTTDFTQSFIKNDRDPIKGNILLQRPDYLKITLKSPLNSEILVNKDHIFQTNYDLDQTVRYDRNQMINQIPAAIMLLSSDQLCNFFKFESCIDGKCLFVNNNSQLELVFSDEILKSLTFNSPNFDESKINFENLSMMQKINDSAFSYNQQVTNLLIFNKND